MSAQVAKPVVVRFEFTLLVAPVGGQFSKSLPAYLGPIRIPKGQSNYWRTLSRAPSKTELTARSTHLTNQSDARAALEDIVWSLLNSKEFLFR